MNRRKYFLKISLLSTLCAILISVFIQQPTRAHTKDLSLAQFVVKEQEAQINLALPTQIVAFADQNQDKQLSATEIKENKLPLEEFINARLVLTSQGGERGKLEVTPAEKSSLPYLLKDSIDSHSQLLLKYKWSKPIGNFKIKYELLDSEMLESSCLANIFYNKQVQNYIFNLKNTELIVNKQNNPWISGKNIGITLLLAFLWGGFHALSPGHGKSLVLAYLVSTRATSKHAVFLGLMTTITHTLGVFSLGLLTLFLSQYILPEQFYPWLSLLSGLGVILIGGYLLIKRLLVFYSNYEKSVLSQGESYHHHHEHSHSHSHSHSHLPVKDKDGAIDWKSLLGLGFSAGLLPCPAALILLLGTISFGKVSLGILLVLVFSLGLAITLISIGILCIKAKTLFTKIPNQLVFSKILLVVAPAFVIVIGLVMVYQAIFQLQFLLI